MIASQVVNLVSNSVASALDAIQGVANVADEIDALGGVSALQAYMETAGVAEAVGFTYADLQNAASTMGLLRSLVRNGAANMGAGSATNLFKVKR
ncbi:MAG: hypothetical protein VKL39_24090 [Leptolyngbyaceae bacterium]|nr:hypothetical protein [Leptolyngbyaceae bacterium]